MSHVFLLTEKRFLTARSGDWYTQQVLDEDKLLSDALLTLGITTTRVEWSDPKIDWTSANAAVFRTTWDYFDRPSEFDAWLDTVQSQLLLINAPSLIRWNMDKHYLKDIEKRGFPIVKTVFIQPGDSTTLSEVMESMNWTEVVLKPCISGGARETHRIRKDQVSAYEPVLQKLVAQESMIIQEFHQSILDQGEVSHMVMGGNYTHSVLKKGKGDDFRIQDDFGGTLHTYEANKAEKAMAEAVFASCSPLPVYGRLDIMWDTAGNPMIGELEIIEPELWLRKHPAAALPFAKGIQRALEEAE